MFVNMKKYREELKIFVFLLEKSKSFRGLKALLEGNPNAINPELPMSEQTELLPYDKTIEFPKTRLRLG